MGSVSSRRFKYTVLTDDERADMTRAKIGAFERQHHEAVLNRAAALAAGRDADGFQTTIDQAEKAVAALLPLLT